MLFQFCKAGKCKEIGVWGGDTLPYSSEHALSGVFASMLVGKSMALSEISENYFSFVRVEQNISLCF